MGKYFIVEGLLEILGLDIKSFGAILDFNTRPDPGVDGENADAGVRLRP
jgi:hypothetical protein